MSEKHSRYEPGESLHRRHRGHEESNTLLLRPKLFQGALEGVGCSHFLLIEICVLCLNVLRSTLLAFLSGVVAWPGSVAYNFTVFFLTFLFVPMPCQRYPSRVSPITLKSIMQQASAKTCHTAAMKNMPYCHTCQHAILPEKHVV